MCRPREPRRVDGAKKDESHTAKQHYLSAHLNLHRDHRPTTIPASSPRSRENVEASPQTPTLNPTLWFWGYHIVTAHLSHPRPAPASRTAGRVNVECFCRQRENPMPSSVGPGVAPHAISIGKAFLRQSRSKTFSSLSALEDRPCVPSSKTPCPARDEAQVLGDAGPLVDGRGRGMLN